MALSHRDLGAPWGNSLVWNGRLIPLRFCLRNRFTRDSFGVRPTTRSAHRANTTSAQQAAWKAHSNSDCASLKTSGFFVLRISLSCVHYTPTISTHLNIPPPSADWFLTSIPKDILCCVSREYYYSFLRATRSTTWIFFGSKLKVSSFEREEKEKKICWYFYNWKNVDASKVNG
jgi:hypothetical protein